MRRLVIGALSGCLLSACGMTALGQGAEAERSRLPCLAPLIWRWEKGEFPLSMGEAFFRGPYHFREFEEVPEEVAVPFPVTGLRDNSEAQQLFDRGVALLHGFRDEEAERAFRQVSVMEPGCAMTYWGLALANGRFPGRATLFASEAKNRLGTNPDEKEKLWIGWLAGFFDEEAEPDETERRRKAVRDLESLARMYPEDLHPQAFLVRQVLLNESRGHMEIASRLAIDRLMDGIAKESPHYPLAIYRVLLWLKDRPEFIANWHVAYGFDTRGALPSQEQWRFGAEVFLARGKPDGGINVLAKAIIVEKRWPGDTGDNLGDSEFLAETAGRWVAVLGGQGRVKDAESAAAGAAALPRNPYRRRNLGRHVAITGVRAEAQRSLLQTLIDWGLWDRVLADGVPSGGSNENIDNYEDMVWMVDRITAEAVAGFHLKGEFDLSGKEAFQQRIVQLEKLSNGLPVTMRDHEAARRYAGSLIDHLKHFVKFCEGGEAPSHGYPFAGPDRLARICLKNERIDEALELAEADLLRRPGVFGARATASVIRFRAGKTKEAIFLLDREFREQAMRADPDLPIFDELKEVADALKLPDDWHEPESRIVSGIAGDFLKHESPKAGDWTLPNWKDEAVSLKTFRGKPVLLVFFLGGGCLHCVEQLTNLVPRAPKFEAAGIPIVAISTEGVELLSQTLGKEADPEKAFPFEIVSDHSLAVFKKYGVFDEFENRALHGTFLVGPDGRILWREISHEPFQHPDFLLEESLRLLGRQRD